MASAETAVNVMIRVNMGTFLQCPDIRWECSTT